MRREEVADGEPDRELVQRRRQPRGEGVHACGQCSNPWGGWVEAFGQGEEERAQGVGDVSAPAPQEAAQLDVWTSHTLADVEALIAFLQKHSTGFGWRYAGKTHTNIGTYNINTKHALGVWFWGFNSF